jgi:hypothetical protein
LKHGYFDLFQGQQLSYIVYDLFSFNIEHRKIWRQYLLNLFTHSGHVCKLGWELGDHTCSMYCVCVGLFFFVKLSFLLFISNLVLQIVKSL